MAGSPRPLRIVATTETPSGRPVDPEITEAFEATLRLLESLGHRVELRAPQFDWRAFYRAFGTVGSAQLAADVRELEQEIGRPPEALAAPLLTAAAAKGPEEGTLRWWFIKNRSLLLLICLVVHKV